MTVDNLSSMTPAESVAPTLCTISAINQLSPSLKQKRIKDSSSSCSFCRICLSKHGSFIQPCACTGSMANVHEACLNLWLEKCGKPKHCEVCQKEYLFAGKEKRRKLFWQWTLPSFSAFITKSFEMEKREEENVHDRSTFITVS